jgi:predicted naringenin-chalcone synthase
MIEIKRKKESDVFVICYVKSGSLITPSCEDYIKYNPINNKLSQVMIVWLGC